MSSKATRTLGAALAAVAIAAACSGGGSDEPEAADTGDADAASATGTTEAAGPGVAFPGEEWERADPEELGLDPAALEAAAQRAEDVGSNCLVVARHGRIAGEWYWNDTDATTAQEAFSVTKSYSSTLVGIAEADGALDIDDPASDYITEWQGTDSEDVTIRNLLSNDSGRFWSFESDYRQLIRAEDQDAYAVGLDQAAPPGETWEYNNAAIQTLSVVLEEATGEPVADFARERLFEPLGMQSSEMTQDPSGNAHMFMGLHSTCEDMARMGHLFLQRGDWDGEQIVPEEWVAEAVDQPSQELNQSYGLLWWLNGGAGEGSGTATGGTEPAGQMAPGAPEDMFFALGLTGQVIAVDPGSGVVVVRLSGEGGNGEEYSPGDAAAVVTEAVVE
jgi:CubicO group peptidase (beta-lactamase class C family)